MEDEGSGNEGLCLLTSEEPLETSEEHARRREKERREEERRGHGRGSLLTAEVQALQTDPAWMLLLYEDLENAFAVHAIPVQTLQRLWYRLQRAQEEQEAAENSARENIAAENSARASSTSPSKNSQNHEQVAIPQLSGKPEQSPYAQTPSTNSGGESMGAEALAWKTLYKVLTVSPGGALEEEEASVMMEILVCKYSLLLSCLQRLHHIHVALQQANAPMQTVVRELRRLEQVRLTVRSKGQGWHLLKRKVNGVTYSHLPQMPREPVFFRTHKS